MYYKHFQAVTRSIIVCAIICIVAFLPCVALAQQCLPTFNLIFDNPEIDPAWQVYKMVSSDIVQPQNGALLMSLLGQDIGISDLHLNIAQYKICGDFDIIVDYELIDFIGGNSSGQGCNAGIEVSNISGGSSFNIVRWSEDRGYRFDAYATTLGASGVYHPTNDQQGALRLTRTGSVVDAYYLQGAVWSRLYTRAYNSNDVRVKVQSIKYGPLPVRVAFDNFRTNAPLLCVATVFPVSAYQLVTQGDYGQGMETRIELKHNIFPQALNLNLNISDCEPCNGLQPSRVELFPRNGTGPVYDVRSGQVYFIIDNSTAPGYYDLRAICSDNSSEVYVANVNYIGYAGYTPSGSLRNALTGNVIRGAGVSLWRWNGSGYNLFSSTIAGDGTYSFDAPPGQYQILVQYELGGSQLRGPFDVYDKSLIPFEETMLQPVTDDTSAPIIEPLDYTRLRIIDLGVGLSVVEPVPGSMVNLCHLIPPFTTGEDTVLVEFTLLDESDDGIGQLLCVDQLGNSTVWDVALGAVTAVEDSELTPYLCALKGSYPNPFNPSTRIEFDLSRASPVLLTVFDSHGRRIRSLLSSSNERAGHHEIEWDGRSDSGHPVPSGVYFCRLETRDNFQTIKLALLK